MNYDCPKYTSSMVYTVQVTHIVEMKSHFRTRYIGINGILKSIPFGIFIIGHTAGPILIITHGPHEAQRFNIPLIAPTGCLYLPEKLHPVGDDAPIGHLRRLRRGAATMVLHPFPSLKQIERNGRRGIPTDGASGRYVCF